MFKEAERYLSTVRDMLRFAVSRFNEAGLAFGHGSDNAHDEAAYLILHTLNLPLDLLEPYLDAVLLPSEKTPPAGFDQAAGKRTCAGGVFDESGLAGRI